MTGLIGSRSTEVKGGAALAKPEAQEHAVVVVARGPRRRLRPRWFSERFTGRARLRRTLGEREYDASYFLYSPHQLALLPAVADGLPHLRYDDAGRVVSMEVDEFSAGLRVRD